MKNIYDLPTPAFLVDVDVMLQNIKEMAKLCEQNGKELWPMVKTHKSVAIAKIQHEYGSKGFLVGTVYEAERLVENGFEKIMIAYPLANPRNIERVISLAKKARIVLCFDSYDSAELVNKLCKGIELEYLVKIDSGLHRFGVPPLESAKLVDRLHRFRNFLFRGIATHPGHAYTKRNIEELKEVAKQECRSMQDARENLQANGYESQIVATGCTPTVRLIVSCRDINTFRPGNYVFYDATQVALGVVTVERCALTVLGTILSHPREDLYIIDVGSKSLGLDKGAHGVTLMNGYGIIKDHPELIVESLSEEVGKIRILGKSSLKIGDKVQIIPNHACSCVNMTSFLIAHSRDVVQGVILVDARGSFMVNMI